MLHLNHIFIASFQNQMWFRLEAKLQTLRHVQILMDLTAGSASLPDALGQSCWFSKMNIIHPAVSAAEVQTSQCKG